MSSRRALDFYETASWQVDALVDHLPELMRARSILCPCVGDGSLLKRLRERRFELVSAERREEEGDWGEVTNDIDPSKDATFHLDATTAGAWARMLGHCGGPDWIVENPPFNVEIDILRHAFEAARVGVAFMSRVSFAEPTEGTKRHPGRGAWLAAHPYSKRITLERYSFTGNGKSDSATTDWLVWSKVPLSGPFGISAYGYRDRPAR